MAFQAKLLFLLKIFWIFKRVMSQICHATKRKHRADLIRWVTLEIWDFELTMLSRKIQKGYLNSIMTTICKRLKSRRKFEGKSLDSDLGMEMESCLLSCKRLENLKISENMEKSEKKKRLSGESFSERKQKKDRNFRVLFYVN